MVKKKRCAAKGCSNYKVPGDGRLMCPFPKPGERQNEWVQGCGDIKLLEENPMSLYLNCYICSSHFGEDMFWNKFKTRLRIGAIPRIFEHPPLSADNMLRLKNRNAFFFTAAPAPLEPELECSVDSGVMRDLDLVMDMDPDPRDPPPTHPPPLENGKRPRVEDAEDEDEVQDFIPQEKSPRLDIQPPLYSRRSLLRIGARERDGHMKRCSKQQLANQCQTSEVTPAVEKVSEYRSQALYLRRKLDLAQRRNSDLTKLLNRKVLEVVSELTLSQTSKLIVEGEFRNFKRKKKARRWTLKEKLFWLSVWKRGTRVYRFLSRYLTIPSEGSLKLLLQRVKLEPGISTPFLNILRRKVQAMKLRDRQCVLLFDEVFLRGRLFYDPRKNIVQGFENFGERGRTNFIADHALVFMAQGVHQKWTQPVAYYFVSKTCPTQMLKLLIKDVVRSLFGIGLNVIATVSDQGPTNRGAITEFRKESGGDSIFYSVDDKNLVHIWDMPHILKNVRNNLLSSDIQFHGQRARWRDLIEFYKYDEALSKMSSLTMRHVHPQGRDKMRVAYAAQVFSGSVAKLIRAISDGRKLGNCLPFAQLCEDVNMCFDLCNGPRVGGNEKPSPFRVNISTGSPHEDKWNSILTILKSWTFIRKKDGVRHIPPCVTGWIENVSSFKVLWCRLVKDNSVKTKILKLRNLNQDAIENFFCLVRQCGGSSSDLTCGQFTAAVKTCMISRFSTLTSSDKNCLDDDSFFATDLSECLISCGEETQTVQQSLCRGDTPDNFGRRAKVQETNPCARQAPTALLSSALCSLSHKIDCGDCKKLLFSSEQTTDTFSCDSTSNMFPSARLVSQFLIFQNSFERQFKRVLFKENVSNEVKSVCLSVVEWSLLICSVHQNSDIQCSVVDKAVSLIIKQKCEDCNKELRAKVSRRTRQASCFKTNTGLRNTEDEVEIDPHDLELLLGPQQLPVPATPMSTPKTMTPVRTPARTPLTTPTPAAATNLVQPMTPRQEARGKVQKAWLGLTPLAATPSAEFSSDNIREMIAKNTLNSSTVAILKTILKSEGQPVSGIKSVLIERVVSHFGE